MEFRGLYETGIKTRNIRSVARLSDCYARLKSKAALGLLTARGATIELLKFVWNPFTIPTWENYARSKINFQRMKRLQDENELTYLFPIFVIIKNSIKI